ncbi:MAG: arylsulfotransferase family protein [Magnetococcus sp. WYHC-3]
MPAFSLFNRIFSQKWVFCLSALVLASLLSLRAGYLARAVHSFPYNLIVAYQEAISALKEWRLYLGIEPSNYLFETDRRIAITSPEPPVSPEDPIFVTGFIHNRMGLFLLNRQGNVIKEWPVPEIGSIWGDAKHVSPQSSVPKVLWKTHLHGAVPLPDGSVVVNHSEVGLVRIDRCGQVVWQMPYVTHHSIFPIEGGRFWVPGRKYHETELVIPQLRPLPYYEDTILEISSEGKITREISVIRLILAQNFAGSLFASGRNSIQIGHVDPTHLNDVEVLSASMAAAFPRFAPGDLLVSLRNINLVMVVDPVTEKIKWHQTGPWLHQHDADFLPDGRIMVYDNYPLPDAPRSSRILAVNPSDGMVDILFQGSGDNTFFADTMGKQQPLEGGHILVTAPDEGRLFEVDAQGRGVWEFVNLYPDGRRAILFEGSIYPRSYFEEGALSCPKG